MLRRACCWSVRNSIPALVILCAVLDAPVRLDAQDRPTGRRDTLRTVIVTATRVAISTAAPLATTTVLRGDALRAAGITRVQDALRLVPGAAIVSSGPVGSQTSLFLRGGNSNYVRVLVDGVPLNDAGGAFDFANLTTDNVDRIEIVRGPASVLYGSDAVTGVVQIFTRDGSGPMAAHAQSGRGTYGTVRSEVALSAGDAYSGFSLAGSRERTDGILAFNNGFSNDVLSAAARLSSGRGSDARVVIRWSGSAYHFPTDFTGAVVDRNSEQSDHRFVASVEGGQRLGDLGDIRLSLASNEFLPRSNDGPDDAADTLGFYGFFSRAVRTHRAVEARLNLRYSRRGVLTLGSEIAADRERSSSLSLSQFGRDPGGFAADRHNTGWYAQALGDATARFSYSVGARVDRNSAFGSFPTVRASIAYLTSNTTRVRASVGSAFKAPSFFENFSTGFVTGNPGLRPERSRGAELGFEQTLDDGALTLKAAAYKQWFKDVIQYSGTAPSPGAPNYFNVAAADANGVEVEANYRPSADLTLAAVYAWTDAHATAAGFDKSTGATYVVGERLIRRPPHVITVSAARSFPGGGSFNLTAMRFGARDDRDFAAFPVKAIVLPAYAKVDLAVQVPVLERLAAGLTLVARVDNLFGATYEEIARFPAPGRAVFVGLRIGR
jgi:vitamin B12 transporter